jgi:plastocyanin
MQHLDEGTIHSWLDGALSAEEAARVEAHVAECPQCAAAVAEARGFIAASSRILTALDHVPRGVVPTASPVRWYNRSAWRAAAAVLVVAVGSLVVVRNSERGTVGVQTAIGIAADSQVRARQPQIMASPGATATSKLQAPPPATPSPQRAIASRASPSIKPTAEADFSAKRADNAPQTKVGTPDLARSEAGRGAIEGYAGVTAMDAVSEPPLKVVGTPRTIGAKVTLYEVAPGDTVTFTEPSNVQLDATVVTAMSAPEPQARRSVQKSAATAITGTATQSPSAAPLQVEVAKGVTTISWPEASTGNVLRLSGRMSVERLKEIKLRIERERAVAAAKKKP